MRFTWMKYAVYASVLGLTALFTSCSEDEDVLDEVTVENFVDRTVFGIQAVGNIGKMGCYEFVFPIAVSYPDGSQTEVGDYRELRVAIAQFIVDYQDTTGVRPTLVYPFDVMDEDGAIITVEDMDEARELRRTCRRDFYQDVRNRIRNRGDRCFALVFPVTIVFPDETTLEASDKDGLKQAVREWKDANPEIEGRPMLQFPVTVEFEDGSTATVESREGFKRLRNVCSEG